MVQFKKSTIEFIQDSFIPTVAIHCSHDAEIICAKNNLTFDELLQPFSRLNSEVKIVDPSNNVYTVNGLKVEFKDINYKPPETTNVKKLFNEAILRDYGASIATEKIISHNNYNFSVNTSTPWFESWRDLFLMAGTPMDHESFKQFFSCIYVVSTSHLSPIDQFRSFQQSEQSPVSNKNLKWLAANMYKYYVLLHDAQEEPISKAHQYYEAIKNTYGSSNCHFLQINSKSSKEQQSAATTDPWLQYTKYKYLNVHTSTNTTENGEFEVKLHGAHLAQSDIDRIKTFVAEFIVRGFIPWLERTLKHLQEQIQSKRGILKTFGLPKKIFGSGSRMTANSFSGMSISSNQQNVSVNQFSSTNENSESYLRICADLVFSFKLYELAHSYYVSWKKELSADNLPINSAAAFEMLSLSSFLQNNNLNKYLTQNYVEDAVNLYKPLISKMPYFVIRFVLFITEILKASNQYLKAAQMFLNMTHEDDLISALFYEQAALCFIHIQQPMIRKYAYNMTVAGYRYNENGKKHHALRVYFQAIRMFVNHGWVKIEDNLNFLISRLNFNLGNIEAALEYVENILKVKRYASNVYENYMIEHYLLCLNRYQDEHKATPIIMLPIFDINDIKLNLVQFDTNLKYGGTLASSVDISYRETDTTMWKNLEEQLYFSNNSKAITSFIPCQKHLFTRLTDNTIFPNVCIDDNISISVEILNPLGVPIVLTEVKLLWIFTEQEHETKYDNSQLDEFNEIMTNLALSTLALDALEKRRIEFFLQPKLQGMIKITGIKYELEIPMKQTSNTNQAVISKTKCKQLWEFKANSARQQVVQRSSNNVADNRFNIKVLPQLPLLHIEIDNFPESILCGEVICANLYFTNLSQVPITNLSVASNLRKDLIFEDDLKVKNDAEQIKLLYSEVVRTNNSSKKDLIHKFNKIIQPAETFKTRVWMQAPRDIKSNTIHFMFYYDCENANLTRSQKNLSYRVSRYTKIFSTHSSLMLNLQNASNSSTNNLTLNIEVENKSASYNQFYDKYEMLNIITTSNLIETNLISNDKNNSVIQKTSLLLQQKHTNLNNNSLSKTDNQLFRISEFPLATNVVTDTETIVVIQGFIKKQLESISDELKNSLLIIITWKLKILDVFKYGFSILKIDNLQERIIKLQYEPILMEKAFLQLNFPTKISIHSKVEIKQKYFRNTQPCLGCLDVHISNYSASETFPILLKATHLNKKKESDSLMTNLIWVGTNKKYLNVEPNEQVKSKFQFMIFKNGIYNSDKIQNDLCMIEVYLKQNNVYSIIKKLKTRLFVIM